VATNMAQMSRMQLRLIEIIFSLRKKDASHCSTRTREPRRTIPQSEFEWLRFWHRDPAVLRTDLSA
jgi:hypothetical protein